MVGYFSHAPRWVDRRELRQVALISLWESAESFDASKGVPFKSYAATRIRWKLIGYLKRERRQRGVLLSEYRPASWKSTAVGAEPDPELRIIDERPPPAAALIRDEMRLATRIAVDWFAGRGDDETLEVIVDRFGLGAKPGAGKSIGPRRGVVHERVRRALRSTGAAPPDAAA